MTALLFLVLFLIYPSTSASIFATFQCEELSDGTRWLRADLSIDCDSTTHTGFSVYAALMILVYPIGTPILYYVLLRRSRAALDQLQAPTHPTSDSHPRTRAGDRALAPCPGRQTRCSVCSC